MHLVNVSLKDSVFANRWKISKLVPLLKSADLDKLSPSAFRPIAMLPTISKIVEKAAQEQLLKHLEDNSLLSSSTHAYRSGLSTTTALLELSEELYKGVEEKKVSAFMALDQSAAFDCVHHELFLRKLEHYSMDASAIKWIEQYLGQRTQFVEIGTAKSRMIAMDRGVPQGSVLGPLLYSLFTNELAEVVRNLDCQNPVHLDDENLFGSDCNLCGKIVQFADDTTYHIASKHRDANQEKMNENLRKIRRIHDSKSTHN